MEVCAAFCVSGLPAHSNTNSRREEGGVDKGWHGRHIDGGGPQEPQRERDAREARPRSRLGNARARACCSACTCGGVGHAEEDRAGWSMSNAGAGVGGDGVMGGAVMIGSPQPLRVEYEPATWEAVQLHRGQTTRHARGTPA
ncbi:hypothetical protein OH77DRAFT_1515073 [Trametes cingulata]|nr:hypothetical protein OH77DRAFT_1515073 [Trametes cingulata]